MKANAIDHAALAASAGAGALAVAANELSVVLFGVPVAMWAAATSGAIFGIAFLPSATESRLSKPWTVLACIGAGVFLGRLVGHLISMHETSVLAGIAFTVAAAPTIVLRFLLRKMGMTDDAE